MERCRKKVNTKCGDECELDLETAITVCAFINMSSSK